MAETLTKAQKAAVENRGGPLLVAAFTQMTGRDSIGVISLALLFAVGGCILFFGRKLFTDRAA